MTNYVSLSDASLDIASKLSNTGAELYAKTAETLQREVPLLAQEYVTWVFWSNLLPILVWTGFLVLVIGLLFKGARAARKAGVDDISSVDLGCLIGGGFLGVLVLMALPLEMVDNAKEMIKAKVAPRVLLVEFVADQVKGGAK